MKSCKAYKNVEDEEEKFFLIEKQFLVAYFYESVLEKTNGQGSGRVSGEGQE